MSVSSPLAPRPASPEAGVVTAPPRPASERLKAFIPAAVATLLFLYFRLPVLLNPGGVNSDGAVTALQAFRMMEGDWAILHWGRDYILSVDSIIAIPFYYLLGKSPLTATIVTMIGQLTCMMLAFAVVKRRVGPWAAVVAVLPIAMATMAFNIYLYFYVREWCLAVAMLSFYLLDGASESRWPLPRYAVGIVMGFMAVFLDLFAIQFMGAVLLFGVLCSFDKKRSWRQFAIRVGVVLGALVVGYLMLKGLQKWAGVSTDRASWSFDKIPENAKLLWNECLPWLVGWKVFYLSDPFPSLWEVGKPLQYFQALGGIIFGLAILSSGALFFYARIPWEVRRVGAVGLAVATSCIAGFLVTHTAVDIWAARMLAPMLLTVPFAFTPLAWMLKGWKFPAVMSPYLVTAAIACWVSYGYYTSGPLPVRTPRWVADEERDVANVLREKGVKYGAANYWLAYRLTFIFNEDPIIVPLASEDRYMPYRNGFDRSAKVAVIFHPSVPWLQPSHIEPSLRRQNAKYETLKIHDFTIFVVDRTPAG